MERRCKAGPQKHRMTPSARLRRRAHSVRLSMHTLASRDTFWILAPPPPLQLHATQHTSLQITKPLRAASTVRDKTRAESHDSIKRCIKTHSKLMLKAVPRFTHRTGNKGNGCAWHRVHIGKFCLDSDGTGRIRTR